jgi:ABC-type polysaccharide transport system permease subunit
LIRCFLTGFIFVISFSEINQGLIIDAIKIMTYIYYFLGRYILSNQANAYMGRNGIKNSLIMPKFGYSEKGK